MSIADVRLDCEILRAQLSLNKKGSCRDLARALGVNANSLNMALSGYRENPNSKEMLVTLRSHLRKISKEKVMPCGGV